ARRRPAPRRLARLRAHRAGPGAPVPRGGLARGRDRGRPLALDGGHAGEGARGGGRPRRLAAGGGRFDDAESAPLAAAAPSSLLPLETLRPRSVRVLVSD